MDEPSRVHVVVRGRVQGVFFRATCAKEARRRGLSGWIRNRPDGAVEAEFEGASPILESMVAWCREGPPSARVEGVDVESVAPTGEVGFVVTA